MENLPKNNSESVEEKEVLTQKMIKLAIELAETSEVFQFPGINPESYAAIKSEQDEYPGYTTPIDKLLVRFQNEGLKIVLTKDSNSENVLTLPSGVMMYIMIFYFLKICLLTEGN